MTEREFKRQAFKFRAAAKRVACPKCGAPARADCVDQGGYPRVAAHRERHQVVRPDYCTGSSSSVSTAGAH